MRGQRKKSGGRAADAHVGGLRAGTSCGAGGGFTFGVLLGWYRLSECSYRRVRLRPRSSQSYERSSRPKHQRGFHDSQGMRVDDSLRRLLSKGASETLAHNIPRSQTIRRLRLQSSNKKGRNQPLEFEFVLDFFFRFSCFAYPVPKKAMPANPYLRPSATSPEALLMGNK